MSHPELFSEQGSSSRNGLIDPYTFTLLRFASRTRDRLTNELACEAAFMYVDRGVHASDGWLIPSRSGGGYI